MPHRIKHTSEGPQRQDPEHGKSPTQFGIFTFFVELLGAGLLLGLGVRFLTDPQQPDAVAWGAFVLTAILLADAIRHIIRISTGRVKR